MKNTQKNSSLDKWAELIDKFVDDLVKRPKGNFSDKDRWLKDWIKTLLQTAREDLIRGIEKALEGEIGYMDINEEKWYSGEELKLFLSKLKSSK